MKRWISLLLTLVLAVSLCACGGGSFAPVDLQHPVPVPADGLVGGQVFAQIRDEHAIATFTGESGDYGYDWTVFYRDVTDPHDVNLALDIAPEGEGVRFTFAEQAPLGFAAVLSLHTPDLWTAKSATVYRETDSGRQRIAPVSMTGDGETILNFALTETDGSFVILPDPEPVPPESDPLPVEPEAQQIQPDETFSVTFSIECASILNNLPNLTPDKLELVPSDGVILPPTEVTVQAGESVYDVLQRVCQENGIHLESSFTPLYNSAYIEGIHNLYEFDCGGQSGWMYRVNGWYPNYGCSRYALAPGDVVEWRYTCNGLGADIGGGGFQ